MSEKVEKAEVIRNYPGLANVGGGAFADALQAQLDGAGIEVTPFTVSAVYPLGNKFIVTDKNGATLESRTVILAPGVQSLKSIVGEEEFLGKGVSYCATCDGFLYKGKRVVAVCSDKKLEGEVLHLAKFAQKVYLVPLYKPCEVSADNIEILRNMPKAITGRDRVEQIEFVKPLEQGGYTLSVDGVFVIKESVSPAVMVSGLQTQDGDVVVDRKMRTSIPGLFAAGDCTGRPYQYTKAAGEGNIAAHSVKEYCAK